MDFLIFVAMDANDALCGESLLMDLSFGLLAIFFKIRQ